MARIQRAVGVQKVIIENRAPDSVRATSQGSHNGAVRRPCDKPPDCHLRGDGVADPWRLVFRSVGQQHQQTQRRAAVHSQARKLLRRRIDPVRILEDYQYRLMVRQARELGNQRIQGELPASLGIHAGEARAVRQGQSQQTLE